MYYLYRELPIPALYLLHTYNYYVVYLVLYIVYCIYVYIYTYTCRYIYIYICVDRRSWTMDHGPIDCGLCTMVDGPWTMDDGPLTMDHGPQNPSAKPPPSFVFSGVS